MRMDPCDCSDTGLAKTSTATSSAATVAGSAATVAGSAAAEAVEPPMSLTLRRPRKERFRPAARAAWRAAARPVGVRWLLHATLKSGIPGGVGRTAPRVATDAIHPMVNLADGRGPPALAAKVLGQGDSVGHRVAERRGEGPRFGRVWSAASQEGLPGR